MRIENESEIEAQKEEERFKKIRKVLFNKEGEVNPYKQNQKDRNVFSVWCSKMFDITFRIDFELLSNRYDDLRSDKFEGKKVDQQEFKFVKRLLQQHLQKKLNK